MATKANASTMINWYNETYGTNIKTNTSDKALKAKVREAYEAAHKSDQPDKTDKSSAPKAPSSTRYNIKSTINAKKDSGEYSDDYREGRRRAWDSKKAQVKRRSASRQQITLPSDYLHYYYVDYLFFAEGDVISQSELPSLKKDAAARQTAIIRQRLAGKTGKTDANGNPIITRTGERSRDAINVFADIVGASPSEIEAIFQGMYDNINDPNDYKVITSGSELYGGKSWQSIANMTMDGFKQNFQNDMNFMSEVVTKTKDVLQKISDYITHYAPEVMSILFNFLVDNKLHANSLSTEYDKKIVEYAREGISTTERANRFGTIYKRPELVNNDTLNQMVTTYIRLNAAIRTLTDQTYKNMLGENFVRKSSSGKTREVTSFQAIVGSIGGSLSAAVGGGIGEHAALVGGMNAHATAISETCGKKFTMDVTGSGQQSKNLEVFLKSSGEVAEAEKILAELSKTSSYTKDDLTVAYSKNGVLGTTGFSVKTTSHINWNTGKFNKRGTLALENKTPLTTVVDSIELFSNHRITKKQVLNVMAAHVMPDDEIPSEYNPVLLFDGVIELITLYSFVNFIAGSGTAGDSSDFMLINGRPILVLDIVEHLMNEVINGKQAIKQQLTSKNAGLFNRDTFVAMNDKIEGDNDYETGMMRSNAVYKKLHEFKLDVSISMASLATLFGK